MQLLGGGGMTKSTYKSSTMNKKCVGAGSNREWWHQMWRREENDLIRTDGEQNATCIDSMCQQKVPAPAPVFLHSSLKEDSRLTNIKHQTVIWAVVGYCQLPNMTNRD